MRLVDLHPEWSEGALVFDCPMCPGRKITVRNHAISHRDDFERVTIVPSVRGTHHGPGRPCGFHANIVDGEVVPAQ